MLTLGSEATVFDMSAAHPAALTVESGTTVKVTTLDCFSNTITSEQQLFSSVGWAEVNPATGPIAVTGANPGDTLKVEILDIEVGPVGTMTTHPDYGALPGTVDERTKRIPVTDGKAIFSSDLQLPISPMIGVIGTAPAEGSVPTGTPMGHGGNMDTKRVAKGATLYLPVAVAGGMLALGDVHALMGDGEVAVCGLEISAEVTIKVSLVPAQPLPLPFLADAEHVISIASDESLSAAVAESTRMMRDLLVERTPLDPTEALMLLSLVGDTKISQIVDPLRTARFELPRAIFETYGITLP